MKLVTRIVLAALAIGVFQFGMQAQSAFAAGGKTGDVVIVTG